jgi:hypothetical protein
MTYLNKLFKCASSALPSRQCPIILVLGISIFSSLTYSMPTANTKYSVKRSENTKDAKENLLIPYVFNSESMGFNVGIAAMNKGYFQDQMTVGGTAFAGDVSKALGLGIWNVLLPKTERLYFSFIGMTGFYPDKRAYTVGTVSDVPTDIPISGSNNSTNEQYIEHDGVNNWFDLKLEYALPFGATAKKGMVEYKLTNGLLVSKPSGGETWNPLTSGAMTLVLRQFNRYQTFELEDEQTDNELSGAVHAIEFGFLYDNTDFFVNPTIGSRQYLSYSHNADWLESVNAWTFVNAEFSKYISLGESDYAHQRILAFNFWTGYSPSWQVEYNDAIRKITNNAPYNEAATLGGFYRMRGYDLNRFHDKAVIYGTAEYRYTLKYNPIADVRWLKGLKLDWFQLVGFIEAGRVGEAYTANALLTDLKFDYGVSFRALTAGVVVRLDIATSSEGTTGWVMANHPF